MSKYKIHFELSKTEKKCISKKLKHFFYLNGISKRKKLQKYKRLKSKRKRLFRLFKKVRRCIKDKEQRVMAYRFLLYARDKKVMKSDYHLIKLLLYSDRYNYYNMQRGFKKVDIYKKTKPSKISFVRLNKKDYKINLFKELNFKDVNLTKKELIKNG